MLTIRLDSVPSTNRYCEALDLQQVDDFTCYWALEQTAGIGQRGNSWVSAAGENLTFSLVLHPTFLPAAEQFRLTQALSLAATDWMEGLAVTGAVVKWPNDIYCDGGKVCGMLVSNRLAGDVIGTAICGIGVNVNQLTFPQWVPHPTSLALLTGRRYTLEPLLQRLLQSIATRYDELRSGKELETEYLSRLMNMGRPARYRHDGHELTATITGVDRHGRLLLTTDDGVQLCCAMKEIELILE